MELREVIGRRRSIRFLLPYKPVEPEKIQRMLEAARLADPHEVDRTSGEGPHRLERRARLEVAVIGRGELVHAAPSGAFARAFAEPDQGVGVGEGQGSEQDEVRDGERGGIGADAKGKSTAAPGLGRRFGL